MRPVATQSSGKGQDTHGGRVERDLIGALLGLMAAAALWWAGSWWWRSAHAAVAAPPRPAVVQTALLPKPPRSDRRRTLALTAASQRTKGAEPAADPMGDAGGEQAVAGATPGPTSFGFEQGHGSEGWSRSDAPERQDFEPRYALDAGAFAEPPPPVAAEAPRAFH